MKLFEQLLEILKGYEVSELFGVPGDAINPFIDVFRKDKDVKYIHVSHEEAGAFAASCQAKLTGKLSVCTGTVGPGAVHLLNGLYDAKMDNAPVLAICGQVPTAEMGSKYHQEVNLKQLFSDVGVFVEEIINVDQMPRIALAACNAALERRGPAVLIIPHDIGGSNVQKSAFNIDINNIQSQLVPSMDRVKEVIQQIDRAGKVTLFAGEGVRGAEDEMLDLAKHLKAPIIRSLKAKDMVPEDHPNYAGGLGLLGDRAGVEAMKGCDLLLMMGTDFPYHDWVNDDVVVVQVNRKLLDANRRVAQAYPLVGDCEWVIPYLLKNTKEKTNNDFVKEVCHPSKLWNFATETFSEMSRTKDTIHPQEVAHLISKHAPENTIYTCDTGEVTVWGARYIKMKKGQRFTASFNLASMAYAMPASMGAQLAFPNRMVVSLSGDGGLNMLMGDLLTFVKYNLPVKIIVFNNGKLGLIKVEQEVEGYPEEQTDLHNPDYMLLAKAVGMIGYKTHNSKELDQILPDFFKEEGPAILDVKINPDELVLPPKITVDQAVGFSLSKIREMLKG